MRMRAGAQMNALQAAAQVCLLLRPDGAQHAARRTTTSRSRALVLPLAKGEGDAVALRWSMAMRSVQARRASRRCHAVAVPDARLTAARTLIVWLVRGACISSLSPFLSPPESAAACSSAACRPWRSAVYLRPIIVLGRSGMQARRGKAQQGVLIANCLARTPASRLRCTCAAPASCTRQTTAAPPACSLGSCEA